MHSTHFMYGYNGVDTFHLNREESVGITTRATLVGQGARDLLEVLYHDLC